MTAELVQAGSVARLDLQCRPVDASHARRHLRAQLHGTVFASRSDDAELAVSELVTNAVMHGRPPAHVVVRMLESVLRVEVHDSDVTVPTKPWTDLFASTGRGLAMVGALTDRSGTTSHAGGKSVWFELHAPACGTGPAAGAAGGVPTQATADQRAGGAVPVGQAGALGAPLAAQAAARRVPADEVVCTPGGTAVTVDDVEVAAALHCEEHTESLLRELALLEPEEPALLHALAQGASQAASKVREVRRNLLQQLTAAATPTVSLRAVCDETERRGLLELSEALDSADALSATTQLLTRPLPTALHLLRRSYLTAFAEQPVA